MLVIGLIIYAVFVLLLQISIHDLRSRPGPPSLKNDSNVSLSSLLSDSLLNSWLHDSSNSEECRVPVYQHFNSLEKTSVKPSVNSEFLATNLRGFSNETKDHFVKSLLSLPSVKVEPDWSVVLGTFEYFDNDNWENYLTQIGTPYLVRLLIGTISETVTISRIFTDDIKGNQGFDRNSLGDELGNTSSDYEIHIVTSFWPISYDTQFRQGESIHEYDFDGSESLNTYFFATPRLFVQYKVKDLWNIIVISHFDKSGKNVTMIERDRMAMAMRYFKRVE